MQHSSVPIANALDGAAVAVFVILELALIIVVGGIFWAALWRVFTKAGRPGWEALIPIYSIYVMCKIVGRPGWWWAMMFVPFAGAIFLILIYIDLARSFGKTDAFAVGLILLSLVFFPILAWGKSVYLGPAGPEGRMAYPPGGPGAFTPPPPAASVQPPRPDVGRPDLPPPPAP